MKTSTGATTSPRARRLIDGTDDPGVVLVRAVGAEGDFFHGGSRFGVYLGWTLHWTANPHVHLGFEVVGYLAGASVYAFTRKRGGDALPDRSRAFVIAAAGIGAAIGMRVLYAASFWRQIVDAGSALSGKTVVGGLLGGLIAVEIAKKIRGIERSTGDLFVLPAIVAMSIGRIGCFLMGPIDRTEGLPTQLPWGVAIADGVRRHPVALYEVAFLLFLIPIVRLAKREGDRFRIFLSLYLLFRLLVDFLKPEPPPIAGGLSAIQWACVAGLGYYAGVFLKRLVRADAERHATVPLL